MIKRGLNNKPANAMLMQEQDHNLFSVTGNRNLNNWGEWWFLGIDEGKDENIKMNLEPGKYTASIFIEDGTLPKMSLRVAIHKSDGTWARNIDQHGPSVSFEFSDGEKLYNIGFGLGNLTVGENVNFSFRIKLEKGINSDPVWTPNPKDITEIFDRLDALEGKSS